MQKITFLLILCSWMVGFTSQGKIDDILTSLKETQNSREFISLSASRQQNYKNDERNRNFLQDRTGKKFEIMYSRTNNMQSSEKFFKNYYKMKIDYSIGNIKYSLPIKDAEKDHSRNLDETETFHTRSAALLDDINISESNKINNLNSKHRNSNLKFKNGLSNVSYIIKSIQQNKVEDKDLSINDGSGFAGIFPFIRNYFSTNFKNARVKSIDEYSIQGSETSRYQSTITSHLNKNINRIILNASLSRNNTPYSKFHDDSRISSTSTTPFHTRLSKNVVASIVAAVIAFIGFIGSAVFMCIKRKRWRNDEERRPLIRQHLDNVLQNE